MEPASPAPPPCRLRDTGLALRHWPAWLLREGPGAALEAAALERHLREELPWAQPRVRLHGREHAVPRLCCWLADPGCAYRYSGMEHHPSPWSAPLLRLRHLLEEQLGCRFNSVLANRYRGGDDAMGWHADDEPELALELADGDLLVMDPPTQRHWQHALPRRRRVSTERLNLTFRLVRPR
jgi:alkylated DNA repair dioxygenase AlkB